MPERVLPMCVSTLCVKLYNSAIFAGATNFSSWKNVRSCNRCRPTSGAQKLIPIKEKPLWQMATDLSKRKRRLAPDNSAMFVRDQPKNFSRVSCTPVMDCCGSQMQMEQHEFVCKKCLRIIEWGETNAAKSREERGWAPRVASFPHPPQENVG